MNHVEAMKQALEALEALEALDAYSWEQVDAARAALRTAIEAAEKQEPVALETVYETIIHWDEGGGKRSRRELARRIVALYTIPPAAQRQPLTDEQLKPIADEYRILFGGWVVDFARAIEAAHGITGDMR